MKRACIWRKSFWLAAITIMTALMSALSCEAGGWYLVVPPLYDLASTSPDPRWEVRDSFEDEYKCRSMLKAIQRGLMSGGLTFDPTATGITAFGMAPLAGTCVSSDDPRLAWSRPSGSGAWYLMTPPVEQRHDPSSVNRQWMQRAA